MEIKKQVTDVIKKKNFNLWASVKDWVISFAVAAVVYFIILPLFLGSATPLVVVSSCSEKPYLNIGDIVVVQGVQMKDVRAQNVEQEMYIGFTSVFDGDKVVQLKFDDIEVNKNTENDIVIYYAQPSGYQIIHRAFAKVNNKYLITMGDNNDVPDQYNAEYPCLDVNKGCLSTTVTQETLVGKQIFAIPWLGHIKLFFCDIMPFCDGHANVGTEYEYKLSC